MTLSLRKIHCPFLPKINPPFPIIKTPVFSSLSLVAPEKYQDIVSGGKANQR